MIICIHLFIKERLMIEDLIKFTLLKIPGKLKSYLFIG
ncbi:hypothetical protein LPE509_01547 [Legionella pneumophila subsp. pneumophila LPE509]|nr:hypothetical protein LPE509_01547 [Legionella pneumophila subsp. pneumophila LPE509]